jgi:hypothetical protein
VVDLLFKPGAVCEQYKRLQKLYDFKNKVLSVMKDCYERVSAPCSHSSSNNPDHEDLSEVNQLSFCLKVEYQEVVYIQEDVTFTDKKNVHNVSQFFFGTKSSSPSPNIYCYMKSFEHHLQ